MKKTSNVVPIRPDIVENDLENLNRLSNSTVYGMFLESEDKASFLKNAGLNTRKYIGVFLQGFNYEADFEKKYGDIFFHSAGSPINRGIISVFYMSQGLNNVKYHASLSTLSPAQIDYVIGFFHDRINPFDLVENHINPILQQLHTRQDYLNVGITSVK